MKLGRNGRLRVLMVVPGFPTAENPYSSAASLTACRLLSAYADVRVLFLRAWRPGRRLVERYEYEGIPVTRLCLPQLPFTHASNIASFRSLGWPIVRAELRDVNILHAVDLVGAGLACCSWAHRSGVRNVIQVIGSDVNSLYPRLRLRRYEAFWQRHVGALLCNSHALANHCAGVFPAVPKIKVVYRGTDLSVFRPTPPPVENRSGQIRFLFLGGFPYDPTVTPRLNLKGGETVLASWKAAEEDLHGHGASLVLAGPGSDSGKVVRWHQHLKYPASVSLAGLLPPKEVPGTIRSADVILLPSLREGLPNVAVEAAASARPVIGSRIPGVEEVVRDGATGLLVKPDDPVSLAGSMIRISSHEYLVGSLGAQARLLAEQQFDNRRFAPRILSLYEEVMMTGPAPEPFPREAAPGKPLDSLAIEGLEQ